MVLWVPLDTSFACIYLMTRRRVDARTVVQRLLQCSGSLVKLVTPPKYKAPLLYIWVEISRTPRGGFIFSRHMSQGFPLEGFLLGVPGVPLPLPWATQTDMAFGACPSPPWRRRMRCLKVLERCTHWMNVFSGKKIENVRIHTKSDTSPTNPDPHRAGGGSRRHTREEIVGGEALAGAEAVDGEGLVESDHRVDEEEQEGRGEGLRRHPWGQ